MKLKTIVVTLFLFVVSLALGACGPQEPAAGTEAPSPADEVTTEAPEPADATEATPPGDVVDIVRRADDLPGPISRSTPTTVKVELETKEVVGTMADGITYSYWTFGGKVPGPMVRARVGDTVELTLTNPADSMFPHSIDLHAVNGPGGGAGATAVNPGESKTFTFKALAPGVYAYHCATAHIPTHIAHGMYGLIVIDPAGGFAKADREFYIMQGDWYGAGEKGQKGHREFDPNKMFDEHPEWVTFNGSVAALTGDNAMTAKVGETVRLFVGNGGPNLVSSFHVIGEIFDAVHKEGATEKLTNVQTTLIPAGGAAWVGFKVDVPGTYILVDHSISRAIDKGAVAVLAVEGDENPDVFSAGENEGH